MKLLIRYAKNQGQGEVSEQVVLNNTVLSIGRGTNQNILLPDSKVALDHAKLYVRDNGCKIVSSSGKYVIKNGQVVKRCSLKLGEEIEISGHKITLLPAELDYDLVLLVSIGSVEQAPLQKRYKLTFSDLKFAKRRWSWTLFWSILSLCLLLPAAGLMNPQWMEQLRQSPLPDDSQWLAGDLIKPHRFIGDDCAQCHTDAFVPTSTETCMSCHSSVNGHINDATLSTPVEEIKECASCHKDHNPQETLSHYSQQICVDCHKEPIKDSTEKIKFETATDFELAHPAFKVSVLTPLTENKKIIDWQPKRHSLKDSQPKEESNLKFPHKTHMNPEGIRSPEGDMTLVCADCHMPEIDGGEMKPITMENNCQNCHQLTFDIEDPTRVVPHGSASDVVMMMREYYAFRYIYQNLDNKADQNDIVNAGNIFDARKARRPGREKKLRKDFQHLLNEQTVDSIEKLTQQTIRSDGLVWAESRAYVAATDIFERQACDVCHVVTKNNDAEIPWEVKPVKLTKQWLPMANFTHDAHQNSDCESCHEASSSKVSSDILIPDIDNCQQCHGGEESHNLIPSTCIDCHNYHDAKSHVLGRQDLGESTYSPLSKTKIALE